MSDTKSKVVAPRRRTLRALVALPALAALGGLMRSGIARAEGDGEAVTYVLSSAARVAQLRERMPADLVGMLRAQAQADLTRTPLPRAIVHTQGLLPREQDHDASIEARKDWHATLLQALAWTVTGDSTYADQAASYLDAWLRVYVSSSNPVDEAELVDLLFGFDLVQARLPAATVEKARALGRQMAQDYLGERRVGDPSTGLNNWQSHRVKLATAGAFLSGDAGLVKAAREAFVVHVERNIGADGLTYDFGQRDAIHYVVYDLEPLIMAASFAAAHGEDWYGSPDTQGRLAAALQWLAPYAEGKLPHEEFVHSSVRFDARRAAAHVDGYSGLWRQEEASNLYWMASRLDPHFSSVVATLDPTLTTRALFA